MEKKKIRVLFIGSFARKNEVISIGGQRYACTTIIESDLSNDVDWIKLDSTGASDTLTPLYTRVFKSIRRFFLYLWLLSTKRVNTVLIFSANGFSILEKGMMALIGKLFLKKVILAPRGGPIVNDLKRPSYRKFISFVFSKCDYIICQGQSWKDIFIALDRRFDESKFIVIRNWIDISAYSTNPSRFTITKPYLDILYLAWVEKAKGIFDLLDAAAIVIKQNQHVRLVIGGDGKELEAIREKARKYGIENNVIMAGWASGEKKEQLLQQADIFVLPSYYEGSPNALKEAMASGIPCIATTVGTIPEIIKDGENGYLYEPGNIEQLSDCLEKLVDDCETRKAFSRNGIETIRKNHDVRNAVVKFKTILA